MDKKYNKTYKIKISDTQDYISMYNGIFKLTDTEIIVLAAFIDVYLSLQSSSIHINPFSTDMKKKVSRDINKSIYTINTHINNLVKKKAIKPDIDGYEIHAMLIPQNEEAIIFNLIYE